MISRKEPSGLGLGEEADLRRSEHVLNDVVHVRLKPLGLQMQHLY